MDIIVNWFILILVSVFDPLAVSLVIAANHLRHIEKEVEPQITDAVTTPVFTNEGAIEGVKEKKSFDLKEESVIFGEFENEEKEFYQEIPNHRYRRGISL